MNEDVVVPRQLTIAEIAALLQGDLVARLATIDSDGYPHVTPIWFVWRDGSFFLTSHSTRPHVRRCTQNPRVGLGIDVEQPLRADGERPNQQVRVVGEATVTDDHDRQWTNLIRRRYTGADSAGPVCDVGAAARSVIQVRPSGMVAVASV